MSRTYRIRHLPTLGIARKFAFSTNKFTTQDQGGDVPIASPHYHPWVKCRANTPANVWYRKNAHSQRRHHEKQRLRSGRDFDEVLMPLWREFFDPWIFS